MIQFKNISKRFGALEVLKQVSFEISGGGVFAILGPNGSGKTTILKILLGIVTPNSGSVCVNQREATGQWQYRREIAYLPQIAQFPDNLKVNELIYMIMDIRGQQVDEHELVEMFDLQPYLNKRLGQLSGGTRQKVNLVLTFMFDSPILILDEPTAGLDPVSLIKLKELVVSEKEKGKIILITTHIMSLVEQLADEILFLLDGTIHFRGNQQTLLDQTGQPDLESSIANLLQ